MDSHSKCRWLVLVPTDFELAKMRPFWPTAFDRDDVTVETCGFGPIAAASRTAQLIARTNAEKVLLVGIAGSYCDQLSIGTASQFQQVGCYGVGLGDGPDFEPANRMGWAHFSSAETKIGDRIRLRSNHGDDDRTLLTCTAASRDEADVRLRLSLFADAVAEDMEGFAMAIACEMANVTQRYIVRGISNRAGDRNKENWQIDEALDSACQLAELVVASHDKQNNAP